MPRPIGGRIEDRKNGELWSYRLRESERQVLSKAGFRATTAEWVDLGRVLTEARSRLPPYQRTPRRGTIQTFQGDSSNGSSRQERKFRNCLSGIEDGQKWAVSGLASLGGDWR